MADTTATFPSESVSSGQADTTIGQHFAEKTTCHGLRFISESPNLYIKLMWTFVIVIALIGLINGITNLAVAYSKYPSYMSIHKKVRSPYIVGHRLPNLKIHTDYPNLPDQPIFYRK